MQEQPPAEDKLCDGIIVRTIAEGVLDAVLDYWWLWIALIVVLVALAQLNEWSRRLEASSKTERGARDRSNRSARRR